MVEETRIVMMVLKQSHECCETMYYRLKADRPMLWYDPSTRAYSTSAPIQLLKKIKTWPHYVLAFCSHCGKKLPANLIETRKEILKKEYGIDNPDDAFGQKLIPHEFL